ncbi:chaps-domain-containing protein [Gonapodya prolifera JEL478]|uniref:Chaps-domain-containing protein n=1 Tax=Gonapodya prolifera (strain JEL478) TaxID=1344416 RepID=A0A139AWQ6_GONPJ|nr:chaps-domain-containing protein [Gonapodya prolifera JEL478]|eukprot:KXS21181.1 chaps-domain-containing protein [Gonapodya prolifera JEL478]
MVVQLVDTFRDIAEFIEHDVGEAIQARTDALASFRELGPPDLIHVIKSNPKAIPKDISSYHFALGPDTSSSATIAAYLNNLQYSLDDVPNWFAKSQYKVTAATYCTFNAFSRVDVRVEVRIPGGVVGYMVDLKGEKHPISNAEIWTETFTSSILRAILDDSEEPDGNDRTPIPTLRKLPPLPSPAAEKRFLLACTHLFPKSWQLGTDPEVQVATYSSNHLVNAIMKHFGSSGRWSDAGRFFEPLARRDPDVASLLAKCYLGGDEEVIANEVLHDAIRRQPYSYSLLLVQVAFLQGKVRMEWAQKLARQAVMYAPSEYVTWAKLTECYVEMGDIESALLTLNSCPMFTYVERDNNLVRYPPAARLSIPLKPIGYGEPGQKAKGTGLEEAFLVSGLGGNPWSPWGVEEVGEGMNEIHPDLLRLPSLTLRGTFLKAYKLLVSIVARVGWDDLLKARSQVFVMEEEYRVQRALAEERERERMEREEALRKKREQEELRKEREPEKPKKETKKPGKGKEKETDEEKEFKESDEKESKDDEAEPKPNEERSEVNGKKSPEADEGDDAVEDVDLKDGNEEDELEDVEVDDKDDDGEDDEDEKDVEEPEVNGKPSPKEGPKAPDTSTAKSKVSGPMGFTFRSKRLCERWLDNLFMVLYEDLRLYTAFKTEMTHCKQQGLKPQQIAYRKTAAEWEVYGDLSLRLEHKEEAKDSYLLALEQRFSAKALLRLMDMYSEEGLIQETLACVSRLAASQDRVYGSTNTYPSPITVALFRLISQHGLAKVQNACLALKNYKLLTKYLEYAETFKVEGVDW